MEEQTNLKTIALKDLWDIFVKRVWLMLLAAIVAGGSFFAYSKLTYVPEYSSKATLYILANTDEDGSSSIGDVNTGINIASKVVKDCDIMLKSHRVVDNVLKDLALRDVYTYDQLKSRISTNNPTDTRILEVTVRARTPEEAKAIVDSVCEIGKEAIDDAVGFEQVNLFEHGVLSEKPSNGTSLTTYILVALVAAILVYGVFFVMFILDDSVWTDEEIAKYLDLSVLGDIPDANSTHKKGYGYRRYGKYGKYGKYSSYGKYGAYSAYGAYGYDANGEAKDAENPETKNKTKSNGGKK